MTEKSVALLEKAGDVIDVAIARVYLGVIAAETGDLVQAAALIEDSLAVFRKTEYVGYLPETQCCLGRVAVKQANLEKAKTLFSEALSFSAERGIKWCIASCLMVLADMAEIEGKIERVVRLLGAAAFMINSIAEWGAWRREERDDMLDGMRAQLGENRFKAAWKEGQAMSLDEAVQYGLNDDE